MPHTDGASRSVYGERRADRRVGKVVDYPPLSELGDLQRREFHEALLDADSFEDLPGRWQAAIGSAEQNRPKLRRISCDGSAGWLAGSLAQASHMT